MCEAAWGYCKWTDDGVGCANGKFLTGKCAGPENRKCCVRDGKSVFIESLGEVKTLCLCLPPPTGGDILIMALASSV